jgi:Xaa-Pro aminopeptidase
LSSASPSAFDAGRIDMPRMCRERRQKLLAAMERTNVDVLLLSSRANVMYATGARSLLTDSSREYYLPTFAVVTRDGKPPHLFTAYPEGAPPDLPAANIHPPFLPEFEEGVRHMAATLKQLLGPLLHGRIGVDGYTAASYALLPELLSGATLVDAGPATGMARLCKTPDEVECLRTAQHINDVAMYDVLAALRPGMRQTDLSGVFLKRILELGATGNHIDPIWMVTPQWLKQGPHMLLNDLAFPMPTTDRILREDDVLMVDTGIEYMGYGSDFGRTWICSLDPKPTPRFTDKFKLWREVTQAVLDAARPGKTGGDIARAARQAAGSKKPWLEQFYILHGIGLDSAEMPMIGTNLGAAFDESIVMQPGMLLVIEPCIYEDGVGGYRSEDTAVVAESGPPDLLSSFPYPPWEGRP